VTRWGLLIGGLVIIADLATLAIIQRSFIPEEQAMIYQTDIIINWVLFSILGILAVRDTRLIYAGILAGLVAAVVDTAVVGAAQIMAPLAGVQLNISDMVINSVLVNAGFAAVSGVVYGLMQRSASGPRPPR
jgi:hypothetical protein